MSEEQAVYRTRERVGGEIRPQDSTQSAEDLLRELIKAEQRIPTRQRLKIVLNAFVDLRHDRDTRAMSMGMIKKLLE